MCIRDREKIALFWHGLFATGYAKLNQARALLNQIDMFREHGMGSFSDLLVNLSKDPAMLMWLDNQDNHKDAINENYGRELLELFSMGAGNYTEHDIKEVSRAFTGWSIGNTDYMVLRMQRDSVWPNNRINWYFEFKPENHDYGEKTFLGDTGCFDGQDIIDIICKQPATARFVSRMLYHHFVADEPPHSEPLAQRQFRLSEAANRFVQELRQLGISLEEAQLALEENFKSEEEKDSFSSLNENMGEKNYRKP